MTLTGIAPAFGAPACSTSHIEVRGMHWRVSGGNYLYVLGDLVNHCAEPTGVKIKVTVRDSAGRVLETDDTWPASLRDIPPDKPYAFEIMHSAMGAARSVSVDVIDVRRWGK